MAPINHRVPVLAKDILHDPFLVLPLIKDFPCAFCASRYKAKSSLNSHMRKKHLELISNTLFTCPFCPKGYTKKCHLDNHLKTYHSAEVNLEFEELVHNRGYQNLVNLEIPGLAEQQTVKPTPSQENDVPEPTPKVDFERKLDVPNHNNEEVRHFNLLNMLGLPNQNEVAGPLYNQQIDKPQTNAPVSPPTNNQVETETTKSITNPCFNLLEDHKRPTLKGDIKRRFPPPVNVPNTPFNLLNLPGPSHLNANTLYRHENIIPGVNGNNFNFRVDNIIQFNPFNLPGSSNQVPKPLPRQQNNLFDNFEDLWKRNFDFLINNTNAPATTSHNLFNLPNLNENTPYRQPLKTNKPATITLGDYEEALTWTKDNEEIQFLNSFNIPGSSNQAAKPPYIPLIKNPEIITLDDSSRDTLNNDEMQFFTTLNLEGPPPNKIAKLSDNPEINFNPQTFNGIETNITEEDYIKGSESPCYSRLVALDYEALVPNSEEFECPICLVDIEKYEGVILRNCLHSFCKECLGSSVRNSEDGTLVCMYRDDVYSCDIPVGQNEIKALVSSEDYERFLKFGLMKAEKESESSFHCKTPNCEGWCFYDDDVNVFVCPVCTLQNCLACQAIHLNENCLEYQERIAIDASTNPEAFKTQKLLEKSIKSGKAMRCPKCRIIIYKQEGCDYFACTMCRTGICWATKGPRWGPKGIGDTSGGCLCGRNGKKCAPKCQNCH